MPHDNLFAGFDLAAAFLNAHPDLPTPVIEVRDQPAGSVCVRWHVTELPHDVALEVLRAFDRWDRMVLTGCTAYRTTVDGVELTVYAATSVTPVTPAQEVNLLDALAEVSA